MPGLPGLSRVFGATFLLLTLILAAPDLRSTPAEALANCDVEDLSLDAEEQAFLKVVNDYRAQRGLQPLTLSENLNRAATWMATDMANKNYFSHGDSVGRLSQTRISDCGGTMSSGENLGAGPQIISAAQAFDLWHTSAPHDANMLYADYKQIGIARVNRPGSYYTYYWVTTFDVRDDGTRAASSTLAGAGILDPAPGTTIGSQAYAFEWAKVQGVYEYWLDIGSCPGCNDIYTASSGLGTEAIVTNLPRDGRAIYVRLSMRTSKGWEYLDYSYTAATFQ